MLEVKHLKRIYKLKNADPVYALNDVSIKFPKKGLVFILGKSGSGKSTLLNVIGGLDVADEGEIIIDGKSSKEFSKGELDSYRNTYLGFIFQEYNILSDYTVKENIALALQLQHKKATDEIIDSILKEVDLEGFGKRKPNELSGGQKQRVAIARALVKEPKIIFGDEPTGALDSNTGKQVFETLKKLSKDKLVVVVSHDREFAESFGDRVIELKDGVIISDVEKNLMEMVTPSKGLSVLGDNVIRISKDHPLTKDDLPVLNEAISKAKDDIYFVADQSVNKAIRQAAKINENGERTEFCKTDESKIKEKNEEFKTIKSKYSLGQAFRMGAKSLRVKPFRLVMTIILSTVSFSLFGASLTLSMFNKENAVISTMERNEITSLKAGLSEAGTGYGFSKERIAQIESGGAKVYPIYGYTSEISMNAGESKTTNDFYHARKWDGIIDVTDNLLGDFGFSVAYGEMPKNEYECAISLYSYYTYKDLGYYINKSLIDKTYVSPENVTPETIIGRTIDVSDTRESFISGGATTTAYKITGIIDTKLPSKFDKYRNGTTKLTDDDPDYKEVANLVGGQTIHSQLFAKRHSDEDSSIIVTTRYSENMPNILAYMPNVKNVYLFDKSKKELGNGECMMTFLDIYNYLLVYENADTATDFKEKAKTITDRRSEEVDEFIDNNYEAFYEKYHTLYEFHDKMDEAAASVEVKKELCKNYFTSKSAENTEEYINFYSNFLKEEIAILDTMKKVPNFSLDSSLKIGTGDNVSQSVSLKVAGIDLDSFYFSSLIKISKNYAETLVDQLKSNNAYALGNNNMAFIAFKNARNSFVKSYLTQRDAYQSTDEHAKGDWCLSLYNSTISQVEAIATIVLVLTHVFVWIGVALAVFSILLFYNFISVSINNKKREIGILRAVGAKRSDVFKIFYSEAFIIAFVNFILSTVAVFVISNSVNASAIKNDGFDFNLMNPNFLVVLALFGISLGASIISSLLPVWKIASKKPIDAIQNR